MFLSKFAARRHHATVSQKQIQKAIILPLACFLVASSASATTLNVPAAYPDIQTAIDAAAPGDTVLVARGLYSVNLDFGGKNIALLSVEGTDRTALISADTSLPTISLESGESPATLVKGFTFFGGGSIAIKIRNESEPVIYGNVFTNYFGNNHVIYVWQSTSSVPLIERNIFWGNQTGGCIGLYNGTARILNNTMSSNKKIPSLYVTGGGGGIQNFVHQTQEIRNNLIDRNGQNTTSGHGIKGNTVVVDFNDVIDNNGFDYTSGAVPGPSDISVDPEYVNPALGDFNLLPTSPAIDAGDPSVQYNDSDGSRNDIGAIPFIVPGPLAVAPNIGADDSARSQTTTPTMYWSYSGPGAQVSYELEVGSDLEWSTV